MAQLTGAFQLFKPSKVAVFRSAPAFLLIAFMPGFLSLIGQILTKPATTPALSNYFSGPATSAVYSAHPLAAIGGLLALLLIPAGFYLELLAAKGKTVTVSKALNGSMKYFWRVLGLVLLVGFIIILGLICFIVPGLIFIQRYFLAPYYMIDKDLGIREAMRASAAASKGKSGAIWGIIGVMVLISLCGIVPVFGSLITLVLATLYTCAPALRYFELSKSAKSAS